MKKLVTALGTSLLTTSLIMPMTVVASPVFPDLNSERYPASVNPSQKMSIYKDCLHTHDRMNGADFKQITKFCSCVADQSIQGDSSLSNCATGSESSSTFGMLKDVAPSILIGIVQGIADRSSKSGGLLGKRGDLIDGLGSLLGGGLLGGGRN